MDEAKKALWAGRDLTPDAIAAHNALFEESHYGTQTFKAISKMVETICKDWRSPSGAAQNIMNLLRGHDLIRALKEKKLKNGVVQDRGPWLIEPRTDRQKELQRLALTPLSDEMLVVHAELFDRSHHGTAPLDVCHVLRSPAFRPDIESLYPRCNNPVLAAYDHWLMNGLIEPPDAHGRNLVVARDDLQRSYHQLELATRPEKPDPEADYPAWQRGADLEFAILGPWETREGIVWDRGVPFQRDS